MCYYFVILGRIKSHITVITITSVFNRGVCGPLGVHQATPGGLGEDIAYKISWYL